MARVAIVTGGTRGIGRAIALRPDVAEYHGNLGEAYRSAGRPDEAIASFRHAIELRPDYPEAENNLGLALQSPELDVRLVTTVADDVESRTRLAWKELGLFHRHDVALATGAPEPLLDPRRPDKAAQFTILTPADTVPAAAHARAACVSPSSRRYGRRPRAARCAFTSSRPSPGAAGDAVRSGVRDEAGV